MESGFLFKELKLDGKPLDDCEMAIEDEMKKGLLLAAKALEIANDWDLPSVQVEPPKEWGLAGGGEDPADGWCGTYELAKKLRELAA